MLKFIIAGSLALILVGVILAFKTFFVSDLYFLAVGMIALGLIIFISAMVHFIYTFKR